ncbi:MAG: DUF4369 domain-containing protein [Flavobacteriaceae bacterium]|nr:DUF4369 domain-containing protein [Flavobacteriaceae bacterium]
MKFQKIIVIALVVASFVSCTNKKTGNMTVEGTIKGLKKGTVYLQKVKDTALVSIDSVQLADTNHFVLTADIESPELFYISLGKKGTKKIPFFAEKGTIQIENNLEKLTFSAKITGSKNQEILEQFNQMVSRFNGKRLDLLKQKFDNYKEGKEELIKKIEQQELNLLKRKMLYATNFALSNATSEVAPYVALISIDDNNVKLLDTIHKSLSEKVKKSVYGKQLGELVHKLKAKK